MYKVQIRLPPDKLESAPSCLLLRRGYRGREPGLSICKQIEMRRCFFSWPLMVTLALASPAMGQDPSQLPDPPQVHSKAPKPENGQGDKNRERDKSAGTVGKSKIEKETGTVNDRIFEVLPNYGTVENAKNLPPMTTGQKFRLATAGVFDWGSYPFNGILAGIAQAKNDPKEWGQGWGAFGKRYGASFADNSIGTYMTTAIFPSMLREDPRYYQLGKGRFAHRAYHASTGSVSFGPIQGTNASTSRNRLAMP